MTWLSGLRVLEVGSDLAVHYAGLGRPRHQHVPCGRSAERAPKHSHCEGTRIRGGPRAGPMRGWLFVARRPTSTTRRSARGSGAASIRPAAEAEVKPDHASPPADC